jgi:LacI family transcriptional regulator
MKHIGRATIKQVASEAGVSTQTVSRVINEKPDVSPETRGRVQTVIEKLNYQPSALARSLIRQRSYTLGVVTAGLRHIGPSRTLNGITTVAEEAGYALLLIELPSYHSNNVVTIFQKLISRHVDGIIWAVPQVGENRNWVQDPPVNIDFPIVYITMEAKENLSVVAVDNYLGGRLAMTHLIEQGYSNIGHISGPQDWWEARQRFKAWEDTLRGAGRRSEKRKWVEGNWSSASGAVAIKQLVSQYPEMDAIFVANDQMALSVLQYASQHGLNVPADLGVIGFDNIPESAFFWPALSTIQQDHYSIAKVAVEEIVARIESGWQGITSVEPKSILLPPALVVRGSTSRTPTHQEVNKREDD